MLPCQIGLYVLLNEWPAKRLHVGLCAARTGRGLARAAQPLQGLAQCMQMSCQHLRYSLLACLFGSGVLYCV